jgi:putative ABC transport system substrate-binding protein
VIAKEIGMKTPVISTVINHPVTLGVKGTEDDGRIKLTGTSYYVDAAKQLELYRSLFPAIKKVGMIFDATNPAGFLAEEPFMREACEEAKLPFASVGVKAKGELQEATRKLVEEGVGVIVIPTNRLVYENLQEVTTLAHGKGVPVVSLNKQAVENGAIAALFADTYNLGRLTAGMARRILVEQAKPSQIGFQYIPEPEIILNLNSAQELQYEFPPEILSSAAIVVQ